MDFGSVSLPEYDWLLLITSGKPTERVVVRLPLPWQTKEGKHLEECVMPEFSLANSTERCLFLLLKLPGDPFNLIYLLLPPVATRDCVRPCWPLA